MACPASARADLFGADIRLSAWFTVSEKDYCLEETHLGFKVTPREIYERFQGCIHSTDHQESAHIQLPQLFHQGTCQPATQLLKARSTCG